MAEQYLDLAEIADLANVTHESIRIYRKRSVANRAAGNPRPGDLPPEDIRLGGIPGWKRRTIDKWLASRPRAGLAAASRTAPMG